MRDGVMLRGQVYNKRSGRVSLLSKERSPLGWFVFYRHIISSKYILAIFVEFHTNMYRAHNTHSHWHMNMYILQDKTIFSSI